MITMSIMLFVVLCIVVLLCSMCVKIEAEVKPEKIRIVNASFPIMNFEVPDKDFSFELLAGGKYNASTNVIQYRHEMYLEVFKKLQKVAIPKHEKEQNNVE